MNLQKNVHRFRFHQSLLDVLSKAICISLQCLLKISSIDCLTWLCTALRSLSLLASPRWWKNELRPWKLRTNPILWLHVWNFIIIRMEKFVILRSKEILIILTKALKATQNGISKKEKKMKIFFLLFYFESFYLNPNRINRVW